MLVHHLDRASGVLTLAPSGPLTAADFASVASEIDAYANDHGVLRGVLIHARAFPGWESFAAFLGHLGFVRDHASKVRRLAFVSDSALLGFAPQVARFFVRADVRHFAYAECDAAAAWLASP